MKNNLIPSLPTAKIQIGHHAAITLDTATTNGQKSLQINIVTENDTINKVIENIMEKVEAGIISSASDAKSEFTESQVEMENVRSEALPHNVWVFIPIIAILAVFGYKAFQSYQKRKWREALLNKGFNLDEIEKADNETKLKLLNSQDELASYDKRKALKYSIVFAALGLSIIFGTIMENAGYFFGVLFLLLGLGLWHYNEKLR